MKTNNLLKSRWSFIFVFAFAIVLSFHFGSSEVFAADSSIATTVTTRTINVTGDGEVTATPDIAYLFLGVVTDKPTTTEAQSANSIAINNVIAAIKKEGIKVEDIKTTNYSINPKYDYDKTTGASTLVGYTVSNTLNVTVKDISKAGQIIDAAVENGANISNGISFGISDYEKYYNMALLDALSNAQGKAKVFSTFLGIKLTTPVNITENSSGTPNNYPFLMNTNLKSADSSASTSIQVGTYKVKATVSLVYEY